MKTEEYIKMRKLEDSHFWFLGKRFFVKTYLKKADFPKRKKLKILDLGCGTGGMTNFLKAFGTVTGIEGSEVAVDFSRKRGLNVFKQDINEFSISGSFDLVTLFDVLYHENIKDEVEILKKVKKILMPGGYVLITDSALDILKSKHDEEVMGKRRYTVKSMDDLVKQSGFEIVNSSYIFFSIFPLIFLKRTVLDKLFPAKKSDVGTVDGITNSFLLNLLKIEAYFLNFFSFPLGSSIIVLAKNK